MAHDFAATRRVRKGLLPSVGPADARPVATDVASPETVVATPAVHDRVVADVRHEIGNYFHKLDYWADFLTESRSGLAGDVTATQMLEDTIRGLEELLRATLEYVRPMAATPIRMQAREVVDGIVRQLVTGLGARPTSVEDGLPLCERGIVLDPGRLSQLLAVLVQRLEGADGTEPIVIRIGVEPRPAGEVLAIRMVGAWRERESRSTIAEVEWATAENVARAVGGELAAEETAGTTTLLLVLPLRS